MIQIAFKLIIIQFLSLHIGTSYDYTNIKKLKANSKTYPGLYCSILLNNLKVFYNQPNSFTDQVYYSKRNALVTYFDCLYPFFIFFQFLQRYPSIYIIYLIRMPSKLQYFEVFFFFEYFYAVIQEILLSFDDPLSKFKVNMNISIIVMQIKTFQQTKQDTQTCTEASLSLNHDPPALEEEVLEINNEEDGKKFENKIKYRKLKQKLSSMSFNHDDKCILTKDFSSPKKQRIMKLALDFEKMIKQQNRDYPTIEMLSKEIYKCLETKSESDLQLLRQSRFIPAFFELLQKLPSLHRTQFWQLLKGLEICLKVLHNFASISLNRDYLILTNRANTFICFIIWLIAKEQKKVPSKTQLNIMYLAFKLVNILFLHKSKEQDTVTIIDTTVQLIICSQVFKKIRYLLIEQFILQQTLIQTETILEVLKFMLFVIKKSQIQLNKTKEKELIVPVGEQIKKANNIEIKLIEFLIPFLINYFMIVSETESIKLIELQGSTYPLAIQRIMLMVLKLINCCFLVSPYIFKKNITQISKETYFGTFLQTLRVLSKYCKRQMQEFNDNDQIKLLLNEIIIFVGYISLQDENIQKRLYQTYIAEEIFNLPVQYIMDSNLRNVYIPTFCCLILDNKVNLNLFLKDNSPQPIIKSLKKEISSKPSLTKKSSCSSLMSLAINNDQYHFLNYETQRLLLELRFPEIYWQSMCNELQKHV